MISCRRNPILIIWSAVIIILIGTGIYYSINHQSSSLPPSGPITVTGEITCLPKTGQGQQTLECAIGLKGFDGRYYGLKNLSRHDPDYKFSGGGTPVEVSGTFSPEQMQAPDGNKYDTVGIIDITSIKETISDNLPGACALETCHGFNNISCGSNPPDACTEIYMIGDKCLQYVKCGVENGKCQQIPNPQFSNCQSCVQRCIDTYQNDNTKVFECESKCN